MRSTTVRNENPKEKLIQQLFPEKKARKKISHKEEKVQIQVCKYLRLQYPDVIFTCDLASGMRLPIHIAAKNKAMRSSRGLPDMFIAKSNWKYSGLFIEIKTSSVYLKDGKTLKADKHLREQNDRLIALIKEGYCAVFGCGFEECKKLIDGYMSIGSGKFEFDNSAP